MSIFKAMADLPGFTLQDKSEDSATYVITKDTGVGEMTYHLVFPGVYVLYNTFRMHSCYTPNPARESVLEIHHCLEGRIECEFENGSYVYIKEGDIAIAHKDTFCVSSSFPLHHYQGITIAIDLEEIKEDSIFVVEGVTIDLQRIKQQITRQNQFHILRSEEAITNIFSKLYTVPEGIKVRYLKLKVLELLLVLGEMDLLAACIEQPYFMKRQVEVIKEIQAFMVLQMDTHYTLEYLSKHFDISLTAMKNCFKGVYGVSIYAYMREYRIRYAARLLRDTLESIMDIGMRVGYQNAGKFSAAFKDIMGISPKEYRKEVITR